MKLMRPAERSPGQNGHLGMGRGVIPARCRFWLPAVVFGMVVLLVVLASPARALQDEYRELQEQFNDGFVPDSTAAAHLPDPTTAREYWLRSRVQANLDRARQDLREAIELSGKFGPRVRYLEEWMKLSLLDEDTSNQDAVFLKKQLRELHEEGDLSGRIWLLGARLARTQGEDQSSRTWLRRARDSGDSGVRQKARLDLADLALESGDLDQAESVLDQYFVDASEGSSAEYWLLRGRLFEQQGADSEAYVAYSHIINEFSGSMVLAAAEKRMNQLTVPEDFADSDPSDIGPPPDPTAKETTTSPGTASGEKTASSEETSAFRLQVGSFRQRRHADDLRDRVKTMTDRRVIITRARVDGRRYFRVQILGFSNRSAAAKTLERIKREGLDGFIIQP